MYSGHEHQQFGHISYSQHGEDLLIVNLFTLMGVDKPSYLDIGAHHPFDLSNTALLYSRGSRGVNVEANPNLIVAFYDNRPDDVNINMGVGLKQGVMPFYMYDDGCGLNSFILNKVPGYAQVIPVGVTTLDNFVNIYCKGTYPDFLSIDIEGLDADVLEDSDFSQSRPKAVCVESIVEDKENEERIKGILCGRGYFCLCRCGANLIFVRYEYADKVR